MHEDEIMLWDLQANAVEVTLCVTVILRERFGADSCVLRVQR